MILNVSVPTMKGVEQNALKERIVERPESQISHTGENVLMSAIARLRDVRRVRIATKMLPGEQRKIAGQRQAKDIIVPLMQ